jgi:phage terminase large subunit-like protein
MTTNGIVMVTFTPLNGYTELLTSFLEACRDNVPPVAST